eukprot:CAMPEP_0181178188 /NCGR_PEP_ID=MMETSP1096-20121128/5589_1 /TAXON_ID=156174 ORGANISM="Chrysochromulina ericina, Strain CCMP281" /NCGR_SAMPLE_ID=MMETSP1096 /ASSEMBLY_ACC=CAM_ASM_000453 /LENGTH=320 /DNA_ID=CAMNT_0023266445 /DNA_START=44 /DNA_END=1006 /DNA_ORIENTATION=+
MWHMVASVLGTLLIMSINESSRASGWPSPSQLWHYKWQMLVIASCTTANIALNNASLTLISLFLNQVIKAAGPMPTMIFSALFQGKRYGWGMMLSCAAIVVGTVLVVMTMRSSGGSNSITGLILVIISTLAASLKPVIMSLVMRGTPEHPKLSPIPTLCYDSFISIWLMMLLWLFWGAGSERVASIDYLLDRTRPDGTSTGILIICSGAAMAFGFNVANYFFVHLTSALTTTVAANGVKVGVIVSSSLISGDSNAGTWLSTAFVCGALVVYAYFSYLAKRAPAAEASGSLLGGKAKGIVTEGTPLTTADPSSNVQCCVIS